jgi:hypothetical protein
LCAASLVLHLSIDFSSETKFTHLPVEA